MVHYNSSAKEAEEVAGLTGGVAVGHDLLEEGAGERLLAKAADAVGGRLDGLVNSASIFEHDLATDVTEDALLKNFRIHAVAPAMLAPDLAVAMPGGLSIGASELVGPRPGMVLIFPSWLSHAVRPYHGDGVRISVAINLTPLRQG